VQSSIGSKGNCDDNAAVETFFKTIKAELVWRRNWEARRPAETSLSIPSTASIIRAAGIHYW
jgi:transposase InsO family protein